MASECRNPWCTQENFSSLRLGNPRCGLTLARRYGLHTEQQEIKDKLLDHTSFGMIRLFQEATQLSSKVKQVDSELHMLIINKQEQDLTQFDTLENCLKRVNFEQHHLTELLKSRDQLLFRLQSRAVHCSFKIDPGFQKHASEIFSGIECEVSQFPEACIMIESTGVDLTEAIKRKQLMEYTHCIVNWRKNCSLQKKLQQIVHNCAV